MELLRIVFSLIILAWASSVSAQVAGTAVGGYASCPNPGLPKDSNGWTVFSSPTTGTTYYVSQNDGNDGNSGTSSVPNPLNTGGPGAAGPWKTIGKAVTQAASDTGKDSWFLFKKGDVFLNQQIGFVNANGLNCAHPMLWSSYDPSQPGVPDPYGNFTISSITCSAGTATATTTSAHGWTNGNPYQLVLTKELPAGFNGEFAATITGAATFTFSVGSCPAASDTTHGIVTTGRPLIEPNGNGSAICLGSSPGGAVGDFFAFVGFHCYAYTYDPYNASFSKSQFQTAMAGSTFVSGGSNLSWHTWRLYEDNQFTALTGSIGDSGNEAGNGVSYYLEINRNVGYHTPGHYIDGIAHLRLRDNISIVQNWDPVFSAGQSVTVATGTPSGTITQSTNNFYVSGTVCSLVQFTATSMPNGLSAGVKYFVTNVSGNNFNLDSTDCTNAHPVAISSPGSGVVAYWEGGSGPGCSFFCSYPQVSVFTHAWYLQAAQYQGATWDININGNIIGLISGTACECGNNGFVWNNLFFQNPSNLIQGKGSPPAWVTSLTWDVGYNGIFDLAPSYGTPSTNITLNGLGDSVSSNTGTVKLHHNVIANEVPLNSSNGTGLGTAGGGVSGATFSINISCNNGNPIKNNNGAIISVSVTTPGSGYTSTSASMTYNNAGASTQLVPFTGGHGIGASGGITVSGGAVTAASIINGNSGPGYVVGDTLTIPNQYIGGTGSGATLTVSSVTSAGNITGLSVGSGGSGYSSAYGNVSISTTSGSGTGDLYQVAIAANGTVTGIYPEFGNSHGFQVGDTITFAAANIGGTGSGAVGTVSAVTSNTYSNNTYQAANCNNLQSATGTINGLPNSVAPPLVPSATPPTDVIGTYFASLPYGYTDTVPGVLSGQISASAMGYVKALSLQQKGNWDTNLTAQAVLNSARPQFGMPNP